MRPLVLLGLLLAEFPSSSSLPAPQPLLAAPWRHGGPQEVLGRLRGGATEAENDSAAAFREDVVELTESRAREKPQLHYISTAGSTYTVLWDTKAWDNHISAWRFWRHIVQWHYSSTARVIIPVVLVFTAWAGFLCWLSHYLKIKISMQMAPLTLVSSALALLLTLRTNQSLTRLMEARLAWGRAVLHARIIAGILSTRMYPVNPAAALLGGRLVCTVGWSIRAAMLGMPADREALEILLPQEEAEWIAQQRKPASAALDRLGYLLRAVVSADPQYSSRPLAAEPHRVLLEQINALDAVAGVCERLLSSPVPPTYTRSSPLPSRPHTADPLLSLPQLVRSLRCDRSRHAARPARASRTLSPPSLNLQAGLLGLRLLVPEEYDQTARDLSAKPETERVSRFTSRILVTWLGCIPLALLGLGIPDSMVVIGTFFTAYVMVGIDEIAIEIEEPMRLLPLNQICNAMMRDVVGRLVPEPPMPPIANSITAKKPRRSSSNPHVKLSFQSFQE